MPDWHFLHLLMKSFVAHVVVDFCLDQQQHNMHQGRSQKVSTESIKLSAIFIALIKMRNLLVLPERRLGFPSSAAQNRWFSS